MSISRSLVLLTMLLLGSFVLKAQGAEINTASIDKVNFEAGISSVFNDFISMHLFQTKAEKSIIFLNNCGESVRIDYHQDGTETLTYSSYEANKQGVHYCPSPSSGQENQRRAAPEMTRVQMAMETLESHMNYTGTGLPVGGSLTVFASDGKFTINIHSDGKIEGTLAQNLGFPE